MLELPEPFEAEGLELRLPTEDDVGTITALCQDEDIREFTMVPSPYRTEDARSFVEMAARAREEDGGVHLLVEADGEVVGAVGMGIHARDRRGVVGYWVGADHRGQGVATRATRALCRWAFDTLDLEHIMLDAAVSNVGSNAIARRLGFTLEGTQRRAFRLGVSGRQVDRNLWGLLPGELT